MCVWIYLWCGRDFVYTATKFLPTLNQVVLLYILSSFNLFLFHHLSAEMYEIKIADRVTIELGYENITSSHPFLYYIPHIAL